MASKVKPPQNDPGEAAVPHKFPSRPADGGNTFSSKSYDLLANYFAINFLGESQKAWKRYYIEVRQVTNQNDVPKGFKLQQIIKQAVAKLGIGNDHYASDFKSQLIVMEPIGLEKREFIEHFTNEQGRAKPYSVAFVGETDIVFDGLRDFVNKQALPATDNFNPYTHFTDVLDACGIVLGHKARSDPGINSQRSGRFFRIGEAGNAIPDTKLM
ncbi:hypothetical protein PG993_009314 [Apiospora rasikravindrae]|uniref:Uncharacterized protein n=1 Tax=Apiospora rasikravindrae TaxID=990691 RepID=A0ABR1SJ18_9PEZI